jgi:tetratricopeptide (TPR) repeat protein
MPAQRPQMPMARPQMPASRPSLPNVSRPQLGQRPSLGNMQRPVATRPAMPAQRPAFPTATTRPSLPAGGARPGIGSPRPGPAASTRPAPRPGLGGVQRPTTLPGQLPSSSNRPSIGGNRPGLGGVQRPATLPGQLPGAPNRPSIGGNRPSIGGNRPGVGSDRPIIGGNRPGIGNDNNFWNSGNIGIGNNFNNINVNSPWGGGRWGYPGAGGWGYPGYGGGWAGAWNGGCVNPHYGWYNGCWGGGWWAPFALGAATWGLASTVGTWGLGSGAWGYSTAYVNPYYSAVPAAVVAASPYDYAQPVAVTTYAPPADEVVAEAAPAAAPADTVTEAERAFDDALARFKAGDYAAALAACDKAVRLAPKDTIVHEVRALALFALARYPEAAAALNAILASAPGMDWTTMSGLYGSVDAYTAHLRTLEEFCRTHGDDAAAHFVLAYHYLVGGHNDMAADALRVVVAKKPGDAVAAQLLASVAPPEATPPPTPAAPASGPETDLVGTWKAVSKDDAVTLLIGADSSFTWKAMPKGSPPVEISGTIQTAADAIALVSEKAGTMTGKVVSKGPDAFEFTLSGGPPGAKPLLFNRQK